MINASETTEPVELYEPHDPAAYYQCLKCRQVMLGAECRIDPTRADRPIVCEVLTCLGPIRKVTLAYIEAVGGVC